MRVTAALRRNGLAVATGLAAALPVIVSTVRGVAEGWLPLADDSIIAVRAFDVFSTHPPLLGQYSSSSQLIGKAVLSPGPMLYWLLALPVRIGEAAPAIAMGVVNTGSIVGIAVLTRRRGGLPLMFAAAAGVALVCRSLDAAILHDVWNPAAAVLPFALLIFLAWSVACGEHRLLPLTALVASFAVQAQLTYVLPVLAMLAVALGFLFTSGSRVPRRWSIATLAVLAICWILPLAEEAVHRPGNIERIVQAATAGAPRLGLADGWRSVVHAVGIPPWWLKGPRTPFERVGDVGLGPGAFATLTAVLVLAGLAAVAVVGFRRRRRDVAAMALIALVLMPPLAAVTAGTPTTGILFATVAYTLWWASAAGMFAWLALGFGAAILLAPRARTVGRPAVAAALAAVGAIGVVVAAGGKPDRLSHAYEPARRIVARLEHTPGTPFVTGSRTSVAFALKGAVIYALRRDGHRFVCSDLPGIGSRYDPARNRYDSVLRVIDHASPAAPGATIAREVIADVPSDVAPRDRAPRPVDVTLATR